MNIVTTYDPPPIPTRSCDWRAMWDGYEPGDAIGFGRREIDAVADLIDQTPDVPLDAIIPYGQSGRAIQRDKQRRLMRGLALAAPLSIVAWAGIVWLAVVFYDFLKGVPQ
ncbi:MAG TPA: hypothetical protein VFB29_00270 [Pseudolabrys sp.]|nr:hypothetical protein [Pseudolabrys sp.]